MEAAEIDFIQESLDSQRQQSVTIDRRHLEPLLKMAKQSINEDAKLRGLLKSIDGYFVDHDDNCELHILLKKHLYGE